MQLDAEEDGQAPFYKPPPEPTVGDQKPQPVKGESAPEPATATDVALEQDA